MVQNAALQDWLINHPMTEFHHGDCIGADAVAARLVHMLHHKALVIVHPGNSPAHRAFGLLVVGLVVAVIRRILLFVSHFSPLDCFSASARFYPVWDWPDDVSALKGP